MSNTIVFFDLETTGLDTDVCDIIQVSAIYGDKVFNGYTVPRCELTESATNVTGFTVSGGKLFRRGQLVATTPLQDVLTSFIAFLRSLRASLVLAAHNGRRFDAPVLTRVLRRCGLLRDFKEVVSGFLDTFVLSKRLHPRMSSYSQQNLVSHFLRRSYEAHNAIEDARMLKELYGAWKPRHMDVTYSTFSVDSF